MYNETHENNDRYDMPKIWKIAHGKSSISDDDNKKLLENNYVGMGFDINNRQGKNFIEIKSSDYFYLVRDKKIVLFGQLTDDKAITVGADKSIHNKDKIIELTNDHMIGWSFREFKRIGNSPRVPCRFEVINQLGGMPSSNSTVEEVKGNTLKYFESEVLKPIFDLELIDLKITVPSESYPDISTKKSSLHKNMPPLNQILFGPPGTGKTYNTVNKAIEIANPYFFINKETGQKIPRERKEIKIEFDRLMKEGQIVFTTFHQSMCYEDFIEGIKPETTPDDKRVIYDVKSGIFKNLCQAATTPNLIGFNAAYEQLIKKLSEIEFSDGDTTEVKMIEIKTPTGKPFSISLNSNNNLSLHTGPNKIKQGTLTKENIQAQINGAAVKYFDGYFEGVCNYLRKNYNYSSTTENVVKNFVLIIDEINRGNVSQIFGELITLIEEDKRLGKDEALMVTLPYSKEKFGVPSNLYIIGTMNTADRSVEALDAALRRRFSFEEMPPDSDLIRKEGKLKGTEGKLGEISLPNLLDTINKRLEKLLDKDHQIGHSYFISVKNLDGLKLAFQNKIIPLLQEYFFGDYGKIGLVLGKGFVEKVPNKSSFADFPDADANDFSERPIFTIKTPTSNNEFVVAIKSLLNQAHDDE